jgi:arginyl-tRNA synthetase
LLVEDEKLKEARLSIVYATSIVLKKGLSILGIECPEKM